jgi:hypothetical protein
MTLKMRIWIAMLCNWCLRIRLSEQREVQNSRCDEKQRRGTSESNSSVSLGKKGSCLVFELARSGDDNELIRVMDAGSTAVRSGSLWPRAKANPKASQRVSGL